MTDFLTGKLDFDLFEVSDVNVKLPPAFFTASIADLDAPVTAILILDFISPLERTRTPSNYRRTNPDSKRTSSVISVMALSLPASINFSIIPRLTMAYFFLFGLLNPRLGSL